MFAQPTTRSQFGPLARVIAFVAVAAVALASVALAGCGRRSQQRPPQQSTAGPQAAANWSQLERDVVELVNGHRARGYVCAGQRFPPTHPLKPQSALQQAARGHSLDMGQHNYFDHASLDGRSAGDRARAAGYPSDVAENIQAGATTAHAVVAAWMASAGHCKNFMNAEYHEIGVGHAVVSGARFLGYWTANMGFGPG